MRILQVIDNFVNLDNTLKIVIEPGDKEGIVKFQYKDSRGDWYTSSLVRKESFIAEPLTPELIKSAFRRAIQHFEAGHMFANIADFLEEEDEDESEDES